MAKIARLRLIGKASEVFAKLNTLAEVEKLDRTISLEEEKINDRIGLYIGRKDYGHQN